jgi:hypothetical protein
VQLVPLIGDIWPFCETDRRINRLGEVARGPRAATSSAPTRAL